MNNDSTGETPSLFGIAIRDVSRLRQVAAAVARHGFGEILHRIPVAGTLIGKPNVQTQEQGTSAERFTKLLATLGPTYIKLGQVLSMRADLLPQSYIHALETLQDDAPTISAEAAYQVIEKGLGAPVEELFAQFNPEPLATASIGQTHRATTHDGREVVVKVQRPGIGHVMRGDLDLLYIAARGLEAGIEELRLIAPSAIIAEFEKSLLRELNFSAELSNLTRARSLLDARLPVTAPEPMPELTCRTVLTMEFFEGKPIRSLDKGSPHARKAAETMLHVLSKSIYLDGFFHGDPHAGNVLINEEGMLCLIDWGLVGTLSPEQRDDLIHLVLATIINDASTIARVLLKMGTATQRIDIGELKRDIHRIRDKYIMVTSIQDLDTTGFIQEFTEAVGRYRVKLATEYSVLVKACGTMEGLIRTLDPDVDALGIMRPYVESVFSDRLEPKALLQRALGGSLGIASLTRTLPTHLDQIVHDFETGNVQIRPLTPQLDRLPDTLYQSATRLAVALFAASMSVCAALTIPDDYVSYPDWIKTFFFLLFGGLAIGGWTVTSAWHWLGRQRSLKITPILRLFRRPK